MNATLHQLENISQVHNSEEFACEAEMSSMLSEEAFYEYYPSIIHSAHDREHPYLMVNKELIRDPNLSLKCMGLIVFMLSHPKDWNINVGYVINHFKNHKGYGRKAIYSLFNEAMKAGYMYREEYLEENLTRTRYFISETPKFKKVYRHSTFRHARNGHLTKEEEYTKDSPPLSSIPHKQSQQKAKPAPEEDVSKNKPKENPNPSHKEKMRQCFPDVDLCIFYEAYHKYESSLPGSIKFPKKWLAKVIEQLIEDAPRQKIIEKRRSYAKKYMQWDAMGGSCVAGENELIKISGSMVTKIPYSDDEFWTGVHSSLCI